MAAVLDSIAPWIVESWLEAFGRFAFSLPTLDIERDLAIGAVAAAVAVLVLLVRAGVRHLPRRERWAVTALLLPVVGLPLVALAGTRYGQAFSAEVRFVTAGLLHGAKPRAKVPPGRPEPRSEIAAAPQPAVPAPPVVAVEQKAAEPAMVPQSPQEPQAVAVTDKPSVAQSAANAISRVAALAARKVQPRSDVRVIPVLYGTDRAADRSGNGLDYSAARAGRLALGRVLVSVPEKGQREERAISDVRELPPEDVGAAAKLEAASARKAKGKALVYVHGLNTSFKAAVSEAVRIAEAAQFDGAVMVYSWPSASHVVQYAYDAQSAAEAKAHLSDFLTFVAREGGVTSISLVADGLGAAVALDALSALAVLQEHGEVLPAAIGDVVLRAPDMAQARFEARVHEIAPLVGKLTLYATASDRGLNISRRYVGAEPRAGDVPAGGPFVVAGVDTVDVTEPPFDPKLAGGAPGSPAMRALGRRLGGGGDGGGLLEEVASAHGAYWRLKAVR